MILKEVRERTHGKRKQRYDREVHKKKRKRYRNLCWIYGYIVFIYKGRCCKFESRSVYVSTDEV